MDSVHTPTDSTHNLPQKVSTHVHGGHMQTLINIILISAIGLTLHDGKKVHNLENFRAALGK